MLEKIESPESKSEVDAVQKEDPFCLVGSQESLRPGMLCPRCKSAKIKYNGMLNLVCPNCGLTETGAST